MSQKWTSRETSPEANFIEGLPSHPALERLKTADNKTLKDYISSDVAPSNIRQLSESCNSFIRSKGKSFKGVHVSTQDARDFMQRFAIGVVMACDEATWDKDVTFKIVPDHDGFAAFNYRDSSITLTERAICTYCKLKQKNTTQKRKDYGNVSGDEFPFILGAEEARHASQVYNDAVAEKTAKLILQALEKEVRTNGAEFSLSPAQIEEDVRSICHIDEPYRKFVERQSGTAMLNDKNDPAEWEAKDFVNTLRPKFKQLANALAQQAIQ